MNKKEYLNIDIDYILNINNFNIHVASAGGKIPDIINQNREQNNDLIEKVKKMPYIFSIDEIILNKNIPEILRLYDQIDFIRTTLNACRIKHTEENMIDIYLNKIYGYSFINYARKGFYSFDRTNINNPDNNQYHLVAYPPHTHDYLDLNLHKIQLREFNPIYSNINFIINNTY